MQLVAEGKLGKDGTVLRKPKHSICVNKIKINHGDEFKLELITDLPPDDNETKILKCIYKEEPRNEFHEALNTILQTFIIRCGLNADLWAQGKITDISLKDTEDGVNATIAARLELSDECKAIARLEEKNISYELKAELDNLLAEIEDYVAGKRRQTSLFDANK